VNNTDLIQKTKPFGIASIILSSAGLLWFMICFSAPKAKWWNSLWFFLFIFVASVLLGFIGRKGIGGIIGIIVGGLGLAVVSFLLYAG
jgi:hypothetical protein